MWEERDESGSGRLISINSPEDTNGFMVESFETMT